MIPNTIRSAMVVLAILALSTATAIATDLNSQKIAIATVNGTPILKGSFDWQYLVFKQRKYPSANGIAWVTRDAFTHELASDYCPSRCPDLSVIRNAFLDAMIDFELLFQESQKHQMRIDKNEVQAILSDMKVHYRNEAEFLADLAELDLTEQAFLKAIQQDVAVKSLVREAVEEKIPVSSEEALQFFNENRSKFIQMEKVRISHILVKFPMEYTESARIEAQKKIETIRDRVQSGADFAALAKEVSESSGDIESGDLGFITMGETLITKSFEDTAFNLKMNEITILRTRQGYDLIKLTDREARRNLTFEEARWEVYKKIVESKKKAAVKSYIAGLRKAARVEKFME